MYNCKRVHAVLLEAVLPLGLTYSICILDNVKALYRRARAHVGAWNPEEAKSDFKRVAELDHSLEVTCRKELKRVEDMEKVKNKEDQEKLRNLFSNFEI